MLVTILPDSHFRAQMDYLKGHGWQGLSLGQALQFAEGPNVNYHFRRWLLRPIYWQRLPSCSRPASTPRSSSRSVRLGKPGYLSKAQVKELSEGFEIGSHSMTHAYLTDLDESGLRHEICDSKLQLEQIIGKPVDHFSCPGGRCDQQVVAVARAAGYKTLATSRIQANSRKTGSSFALGRVCDPARYPL